MLVNKITLKHVDSYVSRPSSPLLLITGGDTDAGDQIISYLHNNIINNSGLRPSQSPILYAGVGDRGETGIEQIRQLSRTLSLQANSAPDTSVDSPITRIAVILNAHKLSAEAQNALLKLLEELPVRTTICLVSESEKSIIPTIDSRCMTVRVLPLSESDISEYLKTTAAVSINAKNALLLSEGNSTILKDLLLNEKSLINEYISMAKTFLSCNVYEKQIVIQKIQKKPEDINLFLRAMQLVVRAAMHNASSNSAKLKWRSRLIEILKVREALQRNANTKLALLNLSVNM